MVLRYANGILPHLQIRCGGGVNLIHCPALEFVPIPVAKGGLIRSPPGHNRVSPWFYYPLARVEGGQDLASDP